jgi:hypothetical protein
MADVAVPESSRPVRVARAPRYVWLRTHAGKIWATFLSVTVLAIMLSSVVQNWEARPRDSFPNSYFPMFSAGRGDLHTEHYVTGWDTAGNRWAIHYSNIAPGGSIVRIRRETVATMVRRGQAAQLCRDVSRRIVERNPRALRSVVTLDVVTGTFSLSEYLRGNKAPIAEKTHATCQIGWKKA